MQAIAIHDTFVSALLADATPFGVLTPALAILESTSEKFLK